MGEDGRRPCEGNCEKTRIFEGFWRAGIIPADFWETPAVVGAIPARAGTIRAGRRGIPACAEMVRVVAGSIRARSGRIPAVAGGARESAGKSPIYGKRIPPLIARLRGCAIHFSKAAEVVKFYFIFQLQAAGYFAT
jgi:hypothetical protein